MNKLATYKYSILLSLKQISPYYATLAAFFVLYAIIASSVGGDYGSLGSWDLLAAMVATAIPLGFKERFHFFLQHGYSRKSIFLNFLICFIITSLFMATTELLLEQFSAVFNVNYHPMFTQLYASRANLVIEGFLWHLATFFSTMCFAFLLVIAFYRMSRRSRILVFVVIPCILFLGFPLFDYVLFGGDLTIKIFIFVLKILGLYETSNPMIALGAHAVISIVGLTGSYFLLQRANLSK